MSFKSIYYNNNLNESYQLEESNSLFVIRYKPYVNENVTINEILAPYGLNQLIQLKTSFKESNVYIYECDFETLGLRNQIKSIIRSKNDERIVYVGTVMQFTGTQLYQIYTENIFIKFKDEIKRKDIIHFFDLYQLKIKRQLNFGKNTYFVELYESLGREIFEFCTDLFKVEIVECCHPELVTKLNPSVKKLLLKNNDAPFLDKDWWLKRVKAFEAWKYSKGSSTTIAIIDDGLEQNHPAFKGKIVSPIDMKNYKNNSFPVHKFDEGHGTACASIACSADENAFGIAPKAQIMPIKITGMGSVLQSEAFFWAVKNGADVISCSWGSPDGNIFSEDDNDFNYPLPDHTRLAFKYAVSHGRQGKGCAIVFAAGNGKEPMINDGYSASSNVIAVSSINFNDEPTIYSDYGTPVFCCFPSGDFEIDKHNNLINKTGIYVADRIGDEGYSTGNYNAYFSGTSASCPGVAGIISLMYAINPSLKLSQVKDILKNSTERIGHPNEYKNNYHQNFGYGLLRADMAVKNTNKTIKKLEHMADSNTHAISLHIGINNVSDTYYPHGAVPPLSGCINDMEHMENLASILGYQTKTLKDKEATKSSILEQITSLGNAVSPSGILLVSYSGHGVQLSDKLVDENNQMGDEEDGKDESWVTYDGILLDDEIYNALAAIKNEIRVLFISDSCHSQTMTKAVNLGAAITGITEPTGGNILERGISRETAEYILNENGSSIKKLLSRSPKRTKDAKAIVINLSACESDQTAKEIDGAGVFTQALIEVYNTFKNNRDSLSYDTFIDEIKKIVNQRVYDQDPNYSISHKANGAFLNQFPFDTKALKGIVPDPNIKPEDINKTELYNDMNNTDENPSILLNTNELIIDYGDDNVQCEAQLGERAVGKGVWDSAYDFVLDKDGVQFVEPNVISNLYYEGETQERGEKTVGSAEYLETYPPFLDQGEDVDFIWHLRNDFSGLEAARNAVFPELALGQTSYDDEVVKIAHIDTGVLQSHPTRPINQKGDGVTIKGTRAEQGAIDKNKKFYPAEQDGHGQATIAILAGNRVGWEHTENRFNGFFGANPFAKVYPIKISDSVVLLSGRRFAKAIDYAIKNKCDVVTMSMAGLPSKVMARAIDRAYEAGIVVVSAASNCWSKNIFKRMAPKKTLYPARYDRVIAAVGCTYTKRPYLNRYNIRQERAAGGLYMQSCYGPAKVMPTTIAAFTPNISWFNKIEKGQNGDNVYYEKGGGGTSSATPQVAAAASLYIQKYRDELSRFKGKDAWKKVEIVREALFQSADKESEFIEDYFGNGILKANNALAPEFAPQKMLPFISKSSEAKKVKNFWAKFQIWGNRGIGSEVNEAKKQVLGDMLMEEIQQLVYLDESLYEYQDLDFDTSNIDIINFPEFIEGLKKSNLSSKFLKSVLNQIDTNEKNRVFKTAREVSNDFGNVKLTSDNTRFSVINKKSYKEGYGFEAFYVDEFEVVVNDSERSLSNKDAGIVLDIDSDNLSLGKDEVLYSTLLVETVYGEDSIVELQVNSNARQTNTRSIKELFPTENNTYILYSNNSQDRSISSIAKRFIVKAIKWVGKKLLKKVISALPQKGDRRRKEIFKLAEKFGDNRYEIMVFDLKKEITNTKTGWKDINTIPIDIYAEINKKDSKEALLLFPGLFSSVESSFDEFLTDYTIGKLQSKYSRYVLGFNMPSVFHGIEKNANEIGDALKGVGLNEKLCTVICHSRGGIVARHLFELNWINNNTLKPTKEAPFILNKLIMAGTPNQGTKMASSENWNSLFNSVLNITKFTVGTFVPVIPTILSAIKAVGVGLTELPGINDLEESSGILIKLNTTKADRSSYQIYITNFEPQKGWLKRLFDERIIDRKIFDYEKNDMVVPLLGAIFMNKEQESIVESDSFKYEVIEENVGVSHFNYFNYRKQKELVNSILENLNASSIKRD